MRVFQMTSDEINKLKNELYGNIKKNDLKSEVDDFIEEQLDRLLRESQGELSDDQSRRINSIIKTKCFESVGYPWLEREFKDMYQERQMEIPEFISENDEKAFFEWIIYSPDDDAEHPWLISKFLNIYPLKTEDSCPPIADKEIIIKANWSRNNRWTHDEQTREEYFLKPSYTARNTRSNEVDDAYNEPQDEFSINYHTPLQQLYNTLKDGETKNWQKSARTNIDESLKIFSGAFKERLKEYLNGTSTLSLVFEGESKLGFGFPIELALLFLSNEKNKTLSYPKMSNGGTISFHKRVEPPENISGKLKRNYVNNILRHAGQQRLRFHIIAAPRDKSDENSITKQIDELTLTISHYYAKKPQERDENLFIFWRNDSKIEKEYCQINDPRPLPQQQLQNIINKHKGIPTKSALESYFGKLKDIRMREDPKPLEVVHIIAHGTPPQEEKGGTIWLPQQERDSDEEIPAMEFANALGGGHYGDLSELISFIFLNVCYGGSALSKYVPFPSHDYYAWTEKMNRLGLLESLVILGGITGGIGYRWSVSHETTHIVATEFYKNLLLRRSQSVPVAMGEVLATMGDSSSDSEIALDYTKASIVTVFQNF